MKRLALDCSTDIATVAALDKEQVLSEKSETGRRNHAAILMPTIDECLKEAGLGFRDIDEVYVCSGPGSFTGVRVGLATALGLCRPLGKPLYIFPYPALVLAEELREYGADYLKKLAEGAFSDGEHVDFFGLLLDAGRRETYCMYLDLAGKKLAGSELLKAGELEARLEEKVDVLSNGAVLCQLVQREDWREEQGIDRVAGIDSLGGVEKSISVQGDRCSGEKENGVGEGSAGRKTGTESFASGKGEIMKKVIYSKIRKELHAKAFFTLPADIQKMFLSKEAEPLYFRKSQAEESLENKKK